MFLTCQTKCRCPLNESILWNYSKVSLCKAALAYTWSAEGKYTCFHDRRDCYLWSLMWVWLQYKPLPYGSSYFQPRALITTVVASIQMLTSLLESQPAKLETHLETFTINFRWKLSAINVSKQVHRKNKVYPVSHQNDPWMLDRTRPVGAFWGILSSFFFMRLPAVTGSKKELRRTWRRRKKTPQEWWGPAAELKPAKVKPDLSLWGILW